MTNVKFQNPNQSFKTKYFNVGHLKIDLSFEI